MTVYVDWKTPKVYTKEEYDNLVLKGAMELVNCDSSFGDWLNYNYYEMIDIFRMTEEDKEKVRAEWFEECKNMVIEDLDCTKYTYVCGVPELLTAFIREAKERG